MHHPDMSLDAPLTSFAVPVSAHRAAEILIIGNGRARRATIAAKLQPDYLVSLIAPDAEALAVIAARPPALIVLDAADTGDAGLALVRALKAGVATRRIPLLLVTTRAGRRGRLDALAAGADDVLDWPLDVAALRWRMRNLLILTGGAPADAAADGRGHDRATAVNPAHAYLTASGAQLAILDALPATIALLDRRGVLMSVNQAWRQFADLNGLAPSANFGIGSSYVDIAEQACLAPDGARENSDVAAGIRAVLRGALPYFSVEYPCHSVQQRRWFMMTVSPLGGGFEGAVIMHMDVSEKYLAEQSLRASDAQFRQMATNIRDIFFLVDTASRQVLYVSPAYEEIVGRTSASLLAAPDSWLAAMLPDDRARIAAEYAAHRKTGAPRFECVFQLMRPDGKLRWLSLKVFAIPGDDGRLARIAGVAQDITESKNALRELRESERRFLELLNNTSLLSVMLDTDGRVTYCNESLLRLTGLARADAIGGNWFTVFMLPTHARALAHFHNLLWDNPKELHYEDHVIDRHGAPRLVSWNSSVLHDHNGKVIGTASIGEDITEQTKSAQKILALNANLAKMSSQLLHAQEQERIALARELHDELGQHLALLKISLHQLRGQLADAGAVALWVTIDAAVATLIAQIRVITVSLRPPSLDYLGLEPALRQLLERQFATGHCSVIFEYAGLPAKLPPTIEIAVYRVVQESITNIVRHARASAVVVELNGGESGRELELIIRDNGVGFDHTAVGERADGGGGGLRGMRERVALLGGHFHVDSRAGHGSRVAVGFVLEGR